ncbi:uncharacterized protein LOC115879764 [Sitophilus oryzae]|uniref:Uncharacterized protein LOC115879764 n=1 Tax=Sitophilus oryzae TaxID=7048 RepID=A0A6J2XNG9_SITOR|nr:uncharacterized protein LOC115879764 [Sitophilus oryzae]
MWSLKKVLKFKIKLLILVLILYMVFCVDSYEFSLKKRVKRKVLFTKSSKFFFRLNGKDNILNYTTLLAHGWGFRISYDLPSSLNQRLRFFKRDVHSDIENINNPIVSKLVYCVLAQVCSIVSQSFLAENCGIFCEIAKIIASARGIEANFFKSLADKCQLYQERCPQTDLGSSIFGFG